MEEKITIYKWAKGLKTNRLQSKQNWKSLVKKADEICELT